MSKLKLLIEQEVEDFIQTQQEKILKFEDDPMGYILQKYPSLEETLCDLLTDSYKDYITGIFVMAPKPTTFKVLLHNGQHFLLIYAKDSYIAKISGKKYYLLNLGEEEYAIKSIADLLLMGTPPGAEGPEEEVDNETITDEASNEEEPPADDSGDEETLSEDKPTKFKIIREGLLNEEEGEQSMKQQIINLLKDGDFDDVMDYIDSDKPNFTNLPTEGNIKNIDKFKALNDEFLMWLYSYTIGATEKVVGVGKMEEFLTFMLDDTNNAGSGDVGLDGGGEVEVKGNQAKIWGQKDGILSTSGFKTGKTALESHFGDLTDEVYLGKAGSATAIAPILIKNVAQSIQSGATKEQALEASIKVLKEFYNTSQSQKFIDQYIKLDTLKDTTTLNTAIFKAQLNAYSDVEGWEYLWIGNPSTGDYRIIKSENIDKAIDSGQLKIASSMGLNNVYRMSIGK